MNVDNIGTYWTTNGKDVWELVAYCKYPTATLVNLKTGEKRGGAIGSLNLQPFTKLIPEKEVKDGN